MATLGPSVLVSLVVVVIVGGVIATVTVTTLASTQPATAAAAHHRAKRPEPAAEPEPAPVAPPEPEPEPEPAGPAVGTATAPAVQAGPRDDELATWDPDGGRIPWWRRLRAAVGLGVASALLGAGLAALVGVGLLLAALLLDRALG